MKLSLGYKLPDERDCTSDIVSDYRESIAEVYFALPGDRSGRSPVESGTMWQQSEARELMLDELGVISAMGKGCVVLFNSACYGGDAASRTLLAGVSGKIRQLLEATNLTAVTTMSPVIAEVVKREFPQLQVRASVNMKVGSIEAMECLATLFDAFYLDRDLNRCPEQIAKLKQWCVEHDKKLHFLANSGCLVHCPFQHFHDNLVAHEKDRNQNDEIQRQYPAPCWDFLARDGNSWKLLTNTWLRPEDLHQYERFFDVAKLATRMHDNPRKVVAAYARGSYAGNLLDLFEPGHGPLLGDSIVDNQRFPDDWFDRTTSCAKNCCECGYCRKVFEQVNQQARGRHSFTTPLQGC